MGSTGREFADSNVECGCRNRGNDERHRLKDLWRTAVFYNGKVQPKGWEKLFDEYLGVLRDSWAGDHSRWAGVKRKLELRVEYVRDGYIGDPREMVKEMHDAFKGELWIDGKLCYKDGEEVLQPFEWDRVSRIFQIAWFRNHSRFWSINKEGEGSGFI